MADSEASESKAERSAQATEGAATEIQDFENALADILQRLGIPADDPKARVVLQKVEMLSAYRGPIPPPEMLERYERLRPGLADEIMGAWRQQREHRQRLETEVTLGSEKRMDRAQRNALIVALAGLALAALTGVMGHWTTAAIIAIVSVGGPSAATVLSRHLPRNRE